MGLSAGTQECRAAHRASVHPRQGEGATAKDCVQEQGLASTSMFGCNLLTGCYSQVPQLALRGESAPHSYRVLRCGWWEE